MQRLALGIIFVLATFATQSFAHTRIVSSEPAHAAEVTAPTELVLEFSASVRLTSVVLQAADGEEIPLSEIPAEMGKTFTVAIGKKLSVGEYVVAVRSIGADAHVVSGKFRFTVTGD